MKIAVPTKYPRSIDIKTASPPVSPRVVARIFITQKPSVTCGTLIRTSFISVFI
jgi:hypothetical protein